MSEGHSIRKERGNRFIKKSGAFPLPSQVQPCYSHSVEAQAESANGGWLGHFAVLPNPSNSSEVAWSQ